MTDFVQDAKTGKWSIPKDPSAVLDYIEDWAPWLDAVGDTLVSHTVTINSGTVVKDSSDINGKTVRAWLSGGLAGETAEVTYRVVTSGGRQDERRFFLKIKER